MELPRLHRRSSATKDGAASSSSGSISPPPAAVASPPTNAASSEATAAPSLAAFVEARKNCEVNGAAEAAAQDTAQGISVIDGLEAMYRIRMKRFFCDLVVFVIFYLCFVGAWWCCRPSLPPPLALSLSPLLCPIAHAVIVLDGHGLHVSAIFKQDEAIVQGLLGSSFDVGYPAVFSDIESQGDVWAFLQGPFQGMLFADAYYNGERLEQMKLGYFKESRLRIIGKVRLRQLRVRNDSCVAERPQYANRDGTCFGAYIETSADTRSFCGHPWVSNQAPLEGRSGWQTSSGVEGTWAGAEKYGQGGIVVDLDPKNRTESVAMINSLFAQRFTDRATRALVMEWSLYSSESKLLTSCILMIEYYHSGYVMPSSTIHTSRIRLYDLTSQLTVFRLIVEPIFILFIVYFAVVQLIKMQQARPLLAYFRDTDNLFDLLIVAISATFCVSFYEFALAPGRTDFDATIAFFKDNSVMLAKHLKFTWGSAAALAILGALRMLKYLSVSGTLFVISTTMNEGFKAMTTFFVSVLVVFFSFAFGAVLLYGPHLAEFHNISSAFSALMRFVLGQFDYAALSRVQPYYTAVYFWLYTVIVSFVLLNMFIAIVCSFYESTKTTVGKTSPWESFSSEQFAADISHAIRVQMMRIHRVCFRQVGSIGANAAEGEETKCPMLCRRPDATDDILIQARLRQERFEAWLKRAIALSDRAGTNLYEYFKSLRLATLDEDPGDASFGTSAADPIGTNRFVSMDELLRLVPEPRQYSTWRGRFFSCCVIYAFTREGGMDSVDHACTAIQLVRSYNRVKVVTIFGPRGQLVLDAPPNGFVAFDDDIEVAGGGAGREDGGIDDEFGGITGLDDDDIAMQEENSDEEISEESDDSIANNIVDHEIREGGACCGLCCRRRDETLRQAKLLEVKPAPGREVFRITKLDRWGRSQWRLFVVENGTIFAYDRMGVLHNRWSLECVIQLEKSNVHPLLLDVMLKTLDQDGDSISEIYQAVFDIVEEYVVLIRIYYYRI